MKAGKRGITVILALALLTPAAMSGQTARKQAVPAAPATGLVWPPPPEQPRIRYLAAMTGEGDFKQQKKSSWVDRLAGQRPEKDQLMLRRPYGVAVGTDSRVYVADSAQQAILVFDREKRTTATWRGSAQVPLSLPVGLALDAQSRLFVSDTRQPQVVVFGPDGRPVVSLGAKLMKRPAGLAVDDRRGRLYVGDVLLRKVLVYDLKSLQLLKQIGGPITPAAPTPDTLSSPANLAVGRDGRLFVSDTLQCRVVVFDAEGQFVRAFGQRGDRPGDFARPKGIALDSEGHVYVLDAAFNNIQVFTADGRLLLFVGSGGEAPGQFTLPTGMAIDHEDRIYVAEHWMLSKGRLQIFRYLPEASQQTAGGPPQAQGTR